MDDFEQQGRDAFNAGIGGDDCPYSFIKSPFWDSKDYARFDSEYRYKLNSWMKGWLSEKQKMKIDRGDAKNASASEV